MNRSLLAAAIALAVVVPSSAFAADPAPADPQDATTLDRIIVIGHRAHHTLDAHGVDARQINRRQPHTSDSARLLDGLPGIHVQSAGGVSALPVIRGMADDRNRVQVDGMDIIASCPNHMNPPLSYLDPSKVGTLTVYAGVVPVSAGGDSIGGAIVAESAPPRFAEEGDGWRLHGELGGHARSNGDVRGAHVNLSLASDAVSIGYDGSIERANNLRAADDFRPFTATGRADHALPRDVIASSGYEVRNNTVTLAARHDIHLVEARIALQSMPYQGFPNQRMDLLQNDQRRLQLRYEGRYGWGQLNARVWDERLDHRMDFGPDRQRWYGMMAMRPGVTSDTVPCAPIGYTCADGMPMLTASTTQGAALKADIALRESDVLRLGIETTRYRLDDWWPPSGGGMFPGAFWNIRAGRRDKLSAYAEWQGAIVPQWNALLGLRATRVDSNAGPVRGYDIDATPPGSYGMTHAEEVAFNAANRARRDHHLDAVASLRWTPSDSFDMEVGLSRKTRSPSLYERYPWSTWAMAAVMNNTSGDGNGYVGNLALKPETAHALHATFAWHAANGDWKVTLSPHASWIRDAIDAQRVSNNGVGQFNVLRYVNQSARIVGVDASGEFTLHKTDAGRYAVGFTAGWLRGENRDTGDALYHQMPLNGRVRLTQQSGDWDNALEWEGVAAKTRVNAVRQETPTAGYGLLHLRLRRSLGAWSVDAGVENLLNKAYAHPLGGLYVAQGRTMGINAIPFGINVPGPGRSFYFGASWTF